MMRAGFVALLVATVATGCTSSSEKVAPADQALQQIPQQDAPRATPTPLPRTGFAFPEGTQLTLVLESSVSSASNQVGDKLTAHLERATGPDERAAGQSRVFPFATGTIVEGRVTEARPSGKVKGRARLALAFDHVVLRGESYPLSASGVTLEADPQHGKDAATIGGGAVLGGIIGALTGSKGGVGKGAVVGTAAGAGVVLLTKGKEVELPQGARVAIRVREAFRL